MNNKPEKCVWFPPEEEMIETRYFSPQNKTKKMR
jgi:hypothetical protein